MTIERLAETAIPGCAEITYRHFEDERGAFVKVFQASVFERHGLPGGYAEIFHSSSRRDVIRGLHFQTPPHDIGKLVTCVGGAAWDVVVDLRAGSPAFGRHATFELSADRATAVVVPLGCAHGFLARTDDAVVLYTATGEFSPEHDAGIRWDSAGIDWPLQGRDPIVSGRDAALPALADFDTPFTFTT